jgi:hypothetical protein
MNVRRGSVYAVWRSAAWTPRLASSRVSSRLAWPCDPGATFIFAAAEARARAHIKRRGLPGQGVGSAYHSSNASRGRAPLDGDASQGEGPVSAYAIDDGERLILIDPINVPDDVRALFGSREVVTVLTSTWHERDAAALGFPVWAPAPDRPEDQLVPATRYAIGDALFGMEAYPGREGQLDLVLWSERIRAVIAGDTLINLGNGLEIPASWLPEGVTVEQVATGLRPLLDKPVEFVLPTHGEPADRAALERALA